MLRKQRHLPRITEKEVREGLCERCRAEYPVWYAPNPLWNRVMRQGVRANVDTFAFICPTCFALIADEQNGSQLIWVLMEDEKCEEYLRAELEQARTDNAVLFAELSAESSPSCPVDPKEQT